MSDCKLVCVDPARVNEIWPYVEELLESAMAAGIGDDDAEWLYRDLEEGRSLLWIAWADDDRLLAAATTRILSTTKDKVMEITSCAGSDLERWRGFLPDLERFGQAEGCRRVRLYGRHGWKAFLPGYIQPWIALEKALT